MINLELLTFDVGLEILLTILAFSLTLCFIRLYLGPTVPDRTVAFDTIAIHAVGILALYSIRIDAPSLLDVAIVTAVLGFLGTTMLASYLERAGPRYYEETHRGGTIVEDVSTVETNEGRHFGADATSVQDTSESAS
jgi:multicomponent Na+:H+ antiporter subunit F